MSGHKMAALDTDVFVKHNLIHLQELSLTDSHISRLHRFSLRNLTNLVKLNLAHNSIKFIPGYAFTSVSELRFLSLISLLLS